MRLPTTRRSGPVSPARSPSTAKPLRRSTQYEQAAKLAPYDYKIQQGLSEAYLAVGRKQEAEECQRHVLRLDPSRGAAYFQLARMNALSASDIEEIERRLEAEATDDKARPYLLLALAHHFDRNGEPAAAFAALSKANAILDRKQSYDPAQVAAHGEKVLHAMSAIAPRLPGGKQGAHDVHRRHAALGNDLGRANSCPPPSGAGRR